MASPPTAPDPTHRLVWNPDSLAGGDDSRSDPIVAAENAVVDAAVGHATVVHLAVDESMFRASHPAGLDALGRFERVPPDERLFQYDDERRARLPEHAADLATVLDFEGAGADGDVWACRLFGVDEFALLDEKRWRYHSIPHHTWCRELYADDHSGSESTNYLAAVERVLEPLAGVAVLPVGPLCAWHAAGADYELTPDRLGVTVDGSRQTFRLRSLDGVVADADRLELACQWRAREDSSASLPRRLVGRVVDRVTGDPPTRLRFETREELTAVVDALRLLRARLDYAYRVK